MAVETYPSFLQDEEYSGETLRHVFGTLLARGSAIGSIVGGLVASTDMQVTAGSGMQVLVATGEAWIPGTSVTTQGGYLGRVTSSTALAISAASESNPRIETIIAQVQDKAVAGGTDSFSVSVVVGTATSGAKLEGGGKPGAGVGSVPASSLVLAYVLVPSKAVSIVSGDIENVAALVSIGPKITIPNEAVTDAKVVKGRLLIESESTYAAEIEAEVQNPSKILKIKPSATRPSILFVHSITAGPVITEVEGVVTGWAGGEKKGTAVAWIEPGKEALITCEPAAKNTCVYTVITL
jgi:hypothetical protein